MLNNFINQEINHNINNINKLNKLNKLNYLNFSKVNSYKSQEKYKDDSVKKINFCSINKLDEIISHDNINIKKINFCSINKDNIKTLDEIISHDNSKKHYNNTLIKINSNIKKINNVYKINYINGPATGFGDFIRGSYFMLQFSEKNNINIDFHIYDNVIKQFLQFFIKKNNINHIIANNIYKNTDINVDFTNINDVIDYKLNTENDNNFINYLNNCNNYSNNIYINTINFPTHNISKKHLYFMKYLLEPTDTIKIEINKILKELDLNFKNYITYHIRLGDEYLENQKNNIKTNIIYKLLNNIVINNENKYLIVSDSISIKKFIKNKYPNVRYLMNEYKHSINSNIDDIKNTLIDFYLMSFSKSIISYSIYPHGSGFSKWCAITYEIPYICYSIL